MMELSMAEAIFLSVDPILAGERGAIMWFDSWDAVKQFAGEDYEMAYVPPKARELLSRFDERSQHYEIREQISYKM